MQPEKRSDYGDGTYRRRIRVVAENEVVTADLEDDFHRFVVRVSHDSERVVAIDAEPHRYPWAVCPGAVAVLRPLVGTPLANGYAGVMGSVDPRLHCTHLLDLTALAVAQTQRADRVRQYDAAVPDRREKRTRATLVRDGEPILAWEIKGAKIREPEPFDGQNIIRTGSFTRFCHETLEGDALEAALVLQRACHISWGRYTDVESIPSAAAMMDTTAGACFTFQPGVAERGTRVKGSVRDFTHAADDLLRSR